MSYATLRRLVEIDSPAGYTDKASDYVAELLRAYGWTPDRTRKGAVRCALGPRPRLALTAHVDTLGAVVSGISGDGTLAISPVGGLQLNYVEGEYVRVVTIDERAYTGTFLLDNPSVHANSQTSKTARTPASMHVRLDEEVHGREDVRALGIEHGDPVCFDPRYQELDSGFIKSRFLDDKAGVYVLFEVARRLAGDGRQAPVELLFSNFEEVGHGGAVGYSPTVEQLLVIDMGVIGDCCGGDELSVSICAKDSSGPYDYRMRKQLIELARREELPYHVDVYPFYSSDGSAALRAGAEVRVALIGPGVAASHGVERTHKRGIEATIELCLAFIDALG